MSLASPILRQIGVIVIGCGNVAQALITQIRLSRDLHAQRYGLQFDLHALCDSTGFVRSGQSGQPLSTEQILQALKFKQEHKRSFAQQSLGVAGDALAMVSAIVPTASPAIVVDASGAEGTAPALLQALKLGAAVTMANKKPLAGQQVTFDALNEPSWRERIKFESTVGAGTPFVAAVQRVIASGDSIRQAQGTFSGTLGYVMSGLEAGKSYSTVVKEAASLGYTEPDPRDDLGGIDVARKALILARLMGWNAEMSDVSVEPLYPASFASLSVPEFLSQLSTQDESYAQKIASAKADGYVLRYVANIEGGKISVGLMAVSAASPLGRLQGTENLLALHTLVYGQSPLVIQGAGAGGGVTAVGILADMVELAGTLRHGKW